MTLGMREASEHIDIFGLPVYRPTTIKRERVGDEIHLIYGTELFDQVVWTHIVIISAEAAIIHADKCLQLALRPAQKVMAS